LLGLHNIKRCSCKYRGNKRAYPLSFQVAVGPIYFDIVKRKPAITLRGRYVAASLASFLCNATYINGLGAEKEKLFRVSGRAL